MAEDASTVAAREDYERAKRDAMRVALAHMAENVEGRTIGPLPASISWALSVVAELGEVDLTEQQRGRIVFRLARAIEEGVTVGLFLGRGRMDAAFQTEGVHPAAWLRWEGELVDVPQGGK